MPDQAKRPLNAVSEQASPASQSTTAAAGRDIFSSLIGQRGSPKLVRRYSGAQSDSDSLGEAGCTSFTSSPENKNRDGDILLTRFQRSFGVFTPSGPEGRLYRRRSSPDISDIPPPSVLIQHQELAAKESATTMSSSDKKPQSVLPDKSFLGKIVGSGTQTSFFSSLAQKRSDTLSPESAESSPSSLTRVPSCPSFSTKEDAQTQAAGQLAVAENTMQSVTVAAPSLSVVRSPDMGLGDVTNRDSVDTTIAKRLGFLDRTRKFGAWLTSAVEGGEKVNISKKDVNVFAPTTF